jgi:CDP-4-dehydro-6-deoxyglucose reductase
MKQPIREDFWIAVPALTTFDFQPGQFVTLDLPIHEKANKRWRSYSIASWPDGSNIFELLIVLDAQGAGTNYLFQEVKVGSELTFRGPQGTFTLHQPLEKDLFFICTGTGIAPFRSMLHSIRTQSLAYTNIYLVFGCRSEQDLLYHEEMQELEKTLPGFKYLPTLSQQSGPGRAGYVHAVYQELCVAKQPADFYLCGWKDMVDEARLQLLNLGYPKTCIRQELYG